VTLAALVVLAHALVGIVFVAGLIGRWLTLGAARADDLPSVKPVLRAADPLERIVMVGSILVLGLGIAAAIAVGRPFLGPLQGGSVDWLFTSLVLFLSLVPLLPLVFVPRGRAFAAALADAETRAEFTPELRAAFRDPVVRAAHLYELTVVSAILILMLTKPF